LQRQLSSANTTGYPGVYKERALFKFNTVVKGKTYQAFGCDTLEAAEAGNRLLLAAGDSGT
jgi:hypothetical protein